MPSHAVLLTAAGGTDKTFWQSHGDEVSAGITIILTFLVAFLVDRFVIGGGVGAAPRFGEAGGLGGGPTPLRGGRRLWLLIIFVCGVAPAPCPLRKIIT